MSEHGTNARWQQHYRDGDEPCEPYTIHMHLLKETIDNAKQPE